MKTLTRMLDKLGSNIHHNRIERSHVSLNGKSSLFINRDKLHGHVLSWNSDLIKCAPSVVLAVVAHLWSHVSALDAFHWHPGFDVSELD